MIADVLPIVYHFKLSRGNHRISYWEVSHPACRIQYHTVTSFRGLWFHEIHWNFNNLYEEISSVQ